MRAYYDRSEEEPVSVSAEGVQPSAEMQMLYEAMEEAGLYPSYGTQRIGCQLFHDNRVWKGDAWVNESRTGGGVTIRIGTSLPLEYSSERLRQEIAVLNEQESFSDDGRRIVEMSADEQNGLLVLLATFQPRKDAKTTVEDCLMLARRIKETAKGAMPDSLNR